MTPAQLLVLALAIKNETVEDANSSTRIGTLFQEMINYLSENVIEPGGIITCNTYSEMLLLSNGAKYKQFFVLSDETNGGEPTRYDWTGTELNWVITQKID